jgi:hypothetical protein
MSEDKKLSARIAELEAAHAKAINQRDWMLDILIDRWHDDTTDTRELHEYLEWTKAQYANWVQDPMDFPDPPREDEHEIR